MEGYGVDELAPACPVFVMLIKVTPLDDKEDGASSRPGEEECDANASSSEFVDATPPAFVSSSWFLFFVEARISDCDGGPERETCDTLLSAEVLFDEQEATSNNCRFNGTYSVFFCGGCRGGGSLLLGDFDR
jgi:hypothetical protein